MSLAHADLATAQLVERGATGVLEALYRMDYLLTDRDVNA